MAEAPGTTSTPPSTPDPAAPPADPAPASTPPSAPPAEAPPAAPPTGSEAAPRGTETPPPEATLFTLPDDFKPPATMVAKFTEAVKGKLADGKVVMSPQDVANLLVDMARDSNTDWQRQIADLNKTNEATCKGRFSSEELAASESAVGFFSSYSPAFRDFAKRQLNDPEFVNAMRIVGELLSEDEIGAPTPPPPSKDNRPLRQRAAEKLYPRKAN